MIALLLERAFVVAFEREPGYWRLFSTTRSWYRNEPVTVVDGIQVIPRVSFATISLGDEGVGVAFDSGHLCRTDMTVADFFDSTSGRGERQERLRRFERLRTRGEQRMGTLLYDTYHDALSVCYFERFEDGVTCDSTGPIQGKESLYEYCRDKHPQADVQPSDSVACVSFRGLPHPVVVPAKLLRLRVMAEKDQSVRGLGQFKTSPPTLRRDEALRAWEICGASVARSWGCGSRTASGVPPNMSCWPVLFWSSARGGRSPHPNGRTSGLTSGTSVSASKSCEAVACITMTRPSNGNSISSLPRSATGGRTTCSRSTCPMSARPSRTSLACSSGSRPCARTTQSGSLRCLGESNPGTTVIVFDDLAADNAAYFLLAHGLPGWKLERLTRRQVQDKWQARSRGRNSDETRKAENRWRDMITLSVIDTLDQMGAVPWRLKTFPYDACLAIDVGEGRRYFAMSLLICRDERRSPSFLRLSRSWPKGDHQHEAINPEMLRDKVVQLLEGFPNSEFAPLQSLLVLRDGRQCSDEPRGLAQAVDKLKQKGKLVQALWWMWWTPTRRRSRT